MKKCLLICLSFLLLCPVLRAQKECGTKLTASDKITYDNLLDLAKPGAAQRSQLASFHYVRVFIHDFLSDDGTDSAWTYSQIITEFNLASTIFSQYNMCLVLTGIDYPRSTAIEENFNTADVGLLAVYNHPSAIDIALHKGLFDGSGPLNGNSYAIVSKWMSLSRGALGQRSFAHEMGHCLGLLHTFETAYGLECPDGSNGSSAGDKIADTRATPDADNYLASNTNASCSYSGNMGIACFFGYQIYNPEIINVMSYGSRPCRSIFSFDQQIMMKSALEILPLLQPVWFENAFATVVAPVLGTMIIDEDDYTNGSTVQIGNYHTTINVEVGGNSSIQKIVSPTRVRITPGVHLKQPSDGRGKIWIKIGGYCYE